MRSLGRGTFREQGRRAAATSYASAVRTLASATSSQKRALNPEQLQGKPAAAETKPLGGGGSAAAAAASASAGGSNPTKAAGTSSLLPPMGSSTASSSSSSTTSTPVVSLAAGVLAVAVGGAYYYFNQSGASSSSAFPSPSVSGKLPASSAASKQTVEPKVAPAPAIPSTHVANQPEKEAPSSSAPPSQQQQVSGHRVVSIQVPEKMKGTLEVGASALAPAVVMSPPDGHRVTSISLPMGATDTASNPQSSAAPTASPAPPSGDSSRIWSDPSMTHRALVQLRTATLEEAREAVVAAHQSLWSSHAPEDGANKSDLRWDVGGTAADDAATLRIKVAQLAAELSERTKWEAVRLKEFLALKEQETAHKYLEILQTQRLEFEDILARRLREQEHQLSSQFQQALMEKEASIQALLKTALETQQAEHETDKQAFEQLKTAEISAQLDLDFSKKLEEYKSKVAQDLQQKVATLASLSKQLAGLESALAASNSSHQGSVKAHKLSAAALALSQKLETSQPAGTELVALQAAAGDKGVIPAALRTIPPAVYSHGAATLPELQARFDDVYKQCRRAAMVPAGRLGLEGQLAGIVFSYLKYPPGPDDAAPEDQPDHPEYLLVRAKKHVQLGELELAVEQLEKLAGQVAFTATDWKTSAMNRVAVEKALRVIKLECALVNESLVE